MCDGFAKCVFHGLSLTEFQQRMKLMKNQYNVPCGDLACLLFKLL